VLTGAGWALAIGLPAALLAQVADAAAGDGGSPLVYPCAVVALAGMAVGGWAVGRDPKAHPYDPAWAGLAAMAVLQLLAVTRTLAAGHHVDVGPLVFLLPLGAVLAMVGAVVARHRAARTRS
jgi:uncharacterized membrane protein YfcA